MATKEDILEQIVEEYLIRNGYFVQHNIKFLPRKDHPDFVSNQDSNHSDIDVVGIHPKLEGDRRVLVVSCKSWQGGFNPASEVRAIREDLVRRGRSVRKSFRELTIAKWSEGFLQAVEDATGTRRFVYVTAVTKLIGDKASWEEYQPFRDALEGNTIEIVTFRQMVVDIQKKLTKTLVATEVGRMLQLFQAAGMKVKDD